MQLWHLTQKSVYPWNFIIFISWQWTFSSQCHEERHVIKHFREDFQSPFQMCSSACWHRRADRLCSHHNKWPRWWPFTVVKQYYKFSEVPITHGSFFLTLSQSEVTVGTFSYYFLKTHHFHDFPFTCFMKTEYWCVGFCRPLKVFYSLSLSTPITKNGWQ